MCSGTSARDERRLLADLPATTNDVMRAWYREKTIQCQAMLGHRARYQAEHDSAARALETGESCRVPLLIEGIIEGYEITGEGPFVYITAFGAVPLDVVEDLGPFQYDGLVDVAQEENNARRQEAERAADLSLHGRETTDR